MTPHRLYHRVPDAMTGEMLHPLNDLASVAPAAAAHERKKYESREHLMAIRLPLLNCLWNDALHMSPIDPRKIKASLVKAGAPGLPDLRFFVLDPRTLNKERAIYFTNSTDTQGKYDFPEADFSWFDPETYRELDEVPEDQLEYNLRILKEGGKPLLWARTAHVFYRGIIDVRGLAAISW